MELFKLWIFYTIPSTTYKLAKRWQPKRETGTLCTMKNDDLITRGVERVIPENLAKQKVSSGKKMRVYWGIDPTGSRIHLGHSIPMRKLQAFADAGHDAILIIGSFTAMIGDPSDRDSMRQPMTREEVERNLKTYKEQASKIFDFSKISVRFNHEWLDELKFQDIIKLASNFTVQQISDRAMFAERMNNNKPVSLHEFLYPLMVGYDSVMLDVDCEIGGTDQEFNMLAGRTLQQAFGKRDKFVLTTPLLEGTDGRKMSKSYENCVYLDEEPREMFGKLLSIRDELIVKYMQYCTDIPMEEIAKAENAMKKGANPKDFKVQLAREIVTMYHSAAAAKQAAEEFNRVFKDGGLPDTIPEVTVKKDTKLLDVLVDQGLIASKSEARRLVEQKGIQLNDRTIDSIDATVEEGIVRVGKRKFLRISLP